MHRKDFQAIAKLRVAEARVLLDNGYFAGAYYLAGYAVECAIKACIARQIKLHDIPDKKLINEFYVHDLEKLIKISGLEGELKLEEKSNPAFGTNWTIVKDWSEQRRYRVSVSEAQARDFYEAVTKRNHGVLSWLKKRW